MKWWYWVVFLCIDVLLLLSGLYYYFAVWLNPYPVQPDFPMQPFVIAPGELPVQIFERLESEQYVQSAHTMQLLFIQQFDSTQIKAGTYTLQNKTARDIAETLVAGQFANELVSVTFIEGSTAVTFGQVATATLINFDLERWNNLTTEFEGQLFPDTYNVPPDYSAEELFTLLREQHDRVMAEELQLVTLDTLDQRDMVILASILEREANDEVSMRTVAGIFLNRLAINMPLQADASIEYVIDTPLGGLPPGQLATELRELDSPYNTYLNTGLPPTPIGNPGRQAIAAILNPIASENLYYITGNDGEFYYAETYNQHLINIERHLR